MLQAFKIINGSQERAKELTADSVFNSLLPTVNKFEAVNNSNAQDVNEEVAAAQRSVSLQNEQQASQTQTKGLSATKALGDGSAATETPAATQDDPNATDWEGIGKEGTGANLTDFVKSFEGFSGNTYADGRQNSSGYGTVARKGEGSISREEAERRLQAELGNHRRIVQDTAKRGGYKFSETQIDALTSFNYNTGGINELLIKNGRRDNATIAKTLPLYNKADLDGKGKKVLRGLTRRRQAEARVFTNDKF